MPSCNKCGIELTDENWATSYKKTGLHKCKNCRTDTFRKWVSDKKEKRNQQSRDRYKKDPEKIRRQNKEWADNNKDKVRSSKRKQLYKLTDIEYTKLLKSQNNKCWICKEKFEEVPHIDHNHNTGKVRGLLCRNCNLGLGHFIDSMYRVFKAFFYLLLKG